ncbi:MAG: hypothetical protein ACI4TM_09565 [Candidatus Cryptobacteroides sp.]
MGAGLRIGEGVVMSGKVNSREISHTVVPSLPRREWSCGPSGDVKGIGIFETVYFSAIV